MNARLAERLNAILPKIISPEFLASQGIGNEIACYIFDYDATDELQVRDHLSMMLERLSTHHSSLRVLHLNVFDTAIEYLRRRRLVDKSIEMGAKQGDAAVLKALSGPLSAQKLTDHISKEHRPTDADLFLLSGIGSAWPMLRAHSLLNCMHPVLGDTPLVMFYPGSFDGTTLRLFGQIETAVSKPSKKPYYRAFRLVP